ncbi:CopD family protein [Escherichia coli]
MIGVLASGVLNALLITGFPPRLRLTGANSYCSKPSRVMIMVVIALANRYVLVPRMRQDEDRAAPRFCVDD